MSVMLLPLYLALPLVFNFNIKGVLKFGWE